MTIDVKAPVQFRWPPRSKLNFYEQLDKLIFSTSDRDFDLSDGLILGNGKKTRTLYMGISTKSTKWPIWTVERIEWIESLIKYDLTFDGYRVSIRRLGEESTPCSQEYKWKLRVQ